MEIFDEFQQLSIRFEVVHVRKEKHMLKTIDDEHGQIRRCLSEMFQRMSELRSVGM